jgi:hypothetical protein
MSKRTVTSLFVVANLAVVVGFIVAVATVVSAVAGGVVAIGGPDVVTVDEASLPGTLAWLGVAALVIVGGGVAAVVSWIGALFNTFRLNNKTWFVAILALGLISFGWVAMVAYLIAGPDGTVQAVTDGGIGTASPI